MYDEKKYMKWSQHQQGQVKKKNTCKIKRYMYLHEMSLTDSTKVSMCFMQFTIWYALG